MEKLTPRLNTENIRNVRQNIFRKNSSDPYLANSRTITDVITDMDHHPYTRWFRGVYYFPSPIVFEREAGWRKLNNRCYNIISPIEKEEIPHHCWEAPCSTVYPCHPQYLDRRSNQAELDVMLNNACIVQYR
jgi:hypothetical protein